MLIWLLINTLLSAGVLLFLYGNTSAPHRLRFFVALCGLCAWLLPWHLLSWNLQAAPPHILQSAILQEVRETLEFVHADASVRTNSGTAANTAFTEAWPAVRWDLIFIAACAVGLVLYARTLISHARMLRKLARSSTSGKQLRASAKLPAHVAVYVQDSNPGAFTSGILKPVIWIHRDLLDSAHLETVLRHEAVHIAQHDNLYLHAITIIDHLFWWNPLVQLLSTQSRHLQELSCDARCAAEHADYRYHLAELVLAIASPQQSARSRLVSNIFKTAPSNAARVRILEHRHPLRKRHCFSAAALCCGALVLVGAVTAQNNGASALTYQELTISKNPATTEFMLSSFEPDGIKSIVGIRPDANGVLASPAPFNQSITGARSIPSSIVQPASIDSLGPTLNVMGSGNGTLDLNEEAGEPYHYLITHEAGVPVLQYHFALRDVPLVALLESLARSIQANRNQTPRSTPDALVLVMEDAAAGNLMLAEFQATELTLEETLEHLSAASGCDIFRDTWFLVVGTCSQ